MPQFSVIIPVYNRIDEVRDLMESLALQSCKDFEVVIVEDGSSAPCKDVVEKYADRVDASYYYKEACQTALADGVSYFSTRIA